MPTDRQLLLSIYLWYNEHSLFFPISMECQAVSNFELHSFARHGIFWPPVFAPSTKTAKDH